MFKAVFCSVLGKLGQASEDEGVSSSVSRGNNVCNGALHVTGLHGPGDKISLFLEDWELARLALSRHVALDMLCQEMQEACLPERAVRSCSYSWSGLYFCQK